MAIDRNKVQELLNQADKSMNNMINELVKAILPADTNAINGAKLANRISSGNLDKEGLIFPALNECDGKITQAQNELVSYLTQVALIKNLQEEK